MTDEVAMRAVATGDLQRAALLYERYKRPLLHFFLHRHPDRETARDLVQHTFERVLRYRSSYRAGLAFRPWLYQIARRALTDVQRTQPPFVSELPDVADDAQESDNASERLRLALANLPADARDVLTLSRFDGLTYAEIAELLGITEGAVKVRVFRALKSLRAGYLKLSNE